MKSILIASAALLVLSACATKPDPIEEVVERPSVVEAPAPIFEETPEVMPPVVAPPVIVQAPQIDLPTPGSIEDFAYQAGGEPRVFFGYDQFDLSSEARDILRRQANWLSIYPDATAIIEGHADERGTREYNLALGARRSDSVKAFLVSQGIAPSRLRTISYGKERPVDGRASEAGWARNRNGFTSLRLGRIS
jgi:peptidoglycan-associated lipoprotein